MKVKVCGLRDDLNIAQLSLLQPDYMGFIFYAPSVRHALDLSSVCLESLPQSIKKVGVFVNASLVEIERLQQKYGFTVAQLHGSESPSFCKQVRNMGLEVIKAISVADKGDLQQANAYEGVVDTLLFDTKTSVPGGSGRQFNWQLLTHYTLSVPFFLSGGIALQDAEAIAAFSHPLLYGVDINSRFEETPGIKNIQEIKEFITLVQ